MIWATGQSNNLEQLFRKQNKKLYAITFSKWNAHTTPLFKHLNILTVYDINKLQTLCFLYKAVNNLLWNRFSTVFILNINIHQHDTGQSSSMHFSFHHTESKIQQNTKSKTFEFIALQYHQFTVFSHL